MTDKIEQMRRYIKNTQQSKYDSRYQVGTQDVIALANMALEHPADAVMLACMYGRAQGLRMGRREAMG